jgi:uncharacterized protein YyaL (SSP411 family)
MNRTAWLPISVLTVAAAACAPAPTAGPRSPAVASAGAPGPTADPEEQGPSAAPRGPLAWASLDAAAFTRARAEGRLVVIDGSAEWCHWCHVMEATTYHDPAVRRVLDERFVAVKVDVDSRPDFEERYGEWGWPATVLMTADGRELGKYRGYLPPERFVEILRAAATHPAGSGPDSSAAAGAGAGAGAERAARVLGEAEIADVAAWTQRQLDERWDAREGSWGRPQKVPLYWDNAWELARARAGDATARQRALFTLDRQRGIVDPTWGGICQYSTDGDWEHPHYEKLMTYQAGAIDNYATAYALTRDAAWLRTAQAVRGFVDGFLTTPEGGFATTMDADLNAHDATRPFMTGRDYNARSDAGRRALGIPRVDAHEYGRENGLAIAAYVTLHEASGDATALAAAERAAKRILATHATERGGITHGARGEEEPGRVLYLADNAAFGFALVRLHEATHDPAYLDAAKRIASFLTTDLLDAKAGGFVASTPDPNAVGVFATPRKPFEDGVMALRFLARLARLDPNAAWRDAIARSLATVANRRAVEDRGRMVGDLLLALDEIRSAR